MADARKKGLGKGLGALISTSPNASPPPADPPKDNLRGERLIHIDPRSIAKNPKQPRTYFDEEALEELAGSIRRDGVQEPVIVRERNGTFELVSGERRVRASVMADLEVVPAILRDVGDRDMLRLGLIENIQREDLNPIEMAQAYDALIKQFNWTQEQLAEEVGKKRATITNALRLLNLPPDVQEQVKDGAISGGHARALLSLESSEDQRILCDKAVSEGLSVRHVEKLVAAIREGKTDRTGTKPAPSKPKKDANFAAIEDDLRRWLGTRVAVRPTDDKRGHIEIEYFSLDELDRLLELFRP